MGKNSVSPLQKCYLKKGPHPKICPHPIKTTTNAQNAPTSPHSSSAFCELLVPSRITSSPGGGSSSYRIYPKSFLTWEQIVKYLLKYLPTRYAHCPRDDLVICRNQEIQSFVICNGSC